MARDVDASITTARNPEFLGAHFAAGGRMYDVRTRRNTFTLSEEAVAYRGYQQRWGLNVPLVDEDGQLLSRLLSHQERHQTNEPFYFPVPQDPDASLDVPAATTGTVGRKVNRLQTTMFVALSAAVPVTPRWFFTLAGDTKVYAHGGLSFYRETAVDPTRPFIVYPQLRKDVAIGTAMNLWPQMYVRYNGIVSINEGTNDRQKSKIITINLMEVLQYG